jgi:NADPH:quinone reductase
MKVTTLPTVVAMLSLITSPWSIAEVHSVPDTMRAAAIDRGEDIEALSIHQLPVPKPNAGEVLIAVNAAGVGVWQTKYRPRDTPDTQFPVIPHSDGAGIVAAVGTGVRGFKVGDAVYGANAAFYAEYATVRAENIAHVPRGIPLTEAGILAISGLSALQGIDDVLNLKAGEKLIIHGASGGVGTLAIQFAKLRGVKVLATVSDEAGSALVSRLGADVVVNGRTGDIAAAARSFAPDGVDAVLGLAGGDALEHCIDALRHDGRGRVAYLYGMEPIPRPRLGMRMSLYTFIAGPDEFERLNKAVESAKLQVPIAAEYSLADAAQAHKRLAAGHLLGKIVVRVGSASPVLADGGRSESPKSDRPGVLFSEPLPDVPGKRLVVVALTIAPASAGKFVQHRHPGSVYVYVTKGAARLGIEGQPVREVQAGGSFFEPPGALHTVGESASPTESASAIAVMIVPEGKPLATVESQKK